MSSNQARLCDFSFNDIYLGAGSRPVVRHLSPAPEGERRRVIPLPAMLQADADRLLAAVRRQRLESGAREFQIIHDGIPYRAALIGPPDEAGLPEHWCLRRLSDQAPVLNELGLPPGAINSFAELAISSGLILIGGAFSCGKSTTAAAVVHHWLVTYGDVAVTLEDPIETPLEGHYESGGVCYQIPVQEDDFASAIKLVRRWAPRYVFMGEIRTPAAAAELLQISIGGPIVLATLQADSLISSLSSLVKWAAQSIGEPLAYQMLSNALRMVAVQRFDNRCISIDWLNVTETVTRTKIRNGRLDQLQDEIEAQQNSRMSRTAPQDPARAGIQRMSAWR